MDAGMVKIEKIVEAVGPGQGGQPARVVSITFRVGTFGPFTENFPAAPFDALAANAKLAAFAAQLAMLNSAV